MEVVEESVVQNVLSEDVLFNVNDGTACTTSAADEIPRSNGVAETDAMANCNSVAVAETTVHEQIHVDSTSDHAHVPIDANKISEPMSVETVVSTEPSAEAVLSTTESDNHLNIENKATLIDNIPELASKIPEEISELIVGQSEEVIEEVVQQAEGSTDEMNVESSDQVTFKTEILVERNENDANEIDKNTGHDVSGRDELDASKNMLSALSDVLHSDNMENNNGSVRQEVLNKEELLNILEGNVEQADDDQFIKTIQDDHHLKTKEAQLALQQLTRLKSARASPRSAERTPRKKRSQKRSENISEAKSTKDEASVDENEMISDEPKSRKVTKVSSTSKASDVGASDSKTSKKDKKASEEKPEGMSTETKNRKSQQKSDSEVTTNEPKSTEAKSKRSRKTVDIILKNSESPAESRVKKENHNASKNPNNMEVGEDDDSETDANKSNSVKEKIVNDLVRDWEDDEPTKDDADEKLLEESQGLIKSTEALATAIETVAESDHVDGSSIDSSISEGTANKTTDDGQPQRRLGRVIKKKVIFDPDNPDTFTKGKPTAKPKEASSDKEHPAPKKIKTEIQQRPKSKSPTGKLHWKKPPPKASKSNKRLSEVDRLLMDEGAVNMIYQLTPEAPKGKKNMRTKAEFIKKIQSTTPDGTEMKFRERKKECIKEEAEAKKIAGGKQRGSLSSSVKSVAEDFETHSADDSIIYRRHSSSSYSSNCMSPLRVNDQDSIALQDASRISRQLSDSQNLSNADEESVNQISEVFISDANTATPSEVINKSDCLSIKQKLNSKLQNVLNKRKRDNTKSDKPAKQKKITPKIDESIIFKKEEEQQLSKLKNLTVKFDHNLAEINVKRKGDQYTIETLKDLELALAYVNNKEDIAVTLLSSECGTLCSSIDLSPLLHRDAEIRSNNAACFAETIRSLLSTVEQHSKLMCAGVSGACSGVGLALAVLADVAVAGERASFAVDSGLLVGTVALTANGRLPKPTVDSLVVFGRRLSAEEAQQGGLVSRVVWPDRFHDTLRSIVKDIAKQPSRTILVKKQLLTANRSGKTFQASLELERDLLADYWTSEEGVEWLRAGQAAP